MEKFNICSTKNSLVYLYRRLIENVFFHENFIIMQLEIIVAQKFELCMGDDNEYFDNFSAVAFNAKYDS